MKSTIYPFSQQTEKKYPNGSYIVVETTNDVRHQIEYDTENILNTIKNEYSTENPIDFTNLGKEELQKLLLLVTKNIVQISF